MQDLDFFWNGIKKDFLYVIAVIILLGIIVGGIYLCIYATSPGNLIDYEFPINCLCNCKE